MHSGFKAYDPGYIHIDVKYLPQMAVETSRRYVFVAIDKATRWGEGCLGIAPVDQFNPERAKPRRHPHLRFQDCGQCAAVLEALGARLSDPHTHHLTERAIEGDIGSRPMASGKAFTDRLFGLRKRVAIA